jgi:surfactin synthase thioesterase subunit
MNVVAFIVADKPIDPEPLRRELSLHLPEYMVPSRFIPVEQLPLTENGKVSKRSLLRMLEAAKEDLAPAAAPTTPAEIELSRAWAPLLDIDVGRIGRFSHFFELGGDSLKAMQLSLRMGERISINDVVKHPHLKDLAKRLVQTAGPPELLIEFGSNAAPTLSIVAFSYAAGNAANFKPLFDELATRRSNLACFGVEMPRLGSSSAEPDLEDTVRMCTEKIRASVHTPLILWGHCSGTALTLAVARRLESENVNVRMIVLGGKVIMSPRLARMRHLATRALSPFMAVDAVGMSWEQIKEWLVTKTGFDGFIGLEDSESRHVADAFRHDVVLAGRFFERAWRDSSDMRVRAPILNVVAKDDLLTRGYRRKYQNWRLFCDHVQLRVLPDGGHYFIKSRPGDAAEVILEAMQAMDRAVVDSCDERSYPLVSISTESRSN